LNAKIYAGLSLDFLKLANASPSDFKKISELLPDLENTEVTAGKQKLTVGKYVNGSWEVV